MSSLHFIVERLLAGCWGRRFMAIKSRSPDLPVIPRGIQWCCVPLLSLQRTDYARSFSVCFLVGEKPIHSSRHLPSPVQCHRELRWDRYKYAQTAPSLRETDLLHVKPRPLLRIAWVNALPNFVCGLFDSGSDNQALWEKGLWLQL